MPDNIFRITTIGLMYGQQIQNQFHLLGPSADPLELQTIAQHVRDNWLAEIRLRHTQALRYNTIKVRLLESQFPTHSETVNIAGNFGFDDEVSTVLAFILRLRSGVIGRKGRGRLYIGGVLKGWTHNGLVDESQINLWNITIGALMGVYGPNGSSPYRLTIVPQKPPFTTNEVTTMQVAPTLGVQRRRNIGIGV